MKTFCRLPLSLFVFLDQTILDLVFVCLSVCLSVCRSVCLSPTPLINIVFVSSFMSTVNKYIKHSSILHFFLIIVIFRYPCFIYIYIYWNALFYLFNKASKFLSDLIDFDKLILKRKLWLKCCFYLDDSVYLGTQD